MSAPQANEAEKNIEIWKVKKLIKRLAEARGNGTSMISLVIREFALCAGAVNQGKHDVNRMILQLPRIKSPEQHGCWRKNSALRPISNPASTVFRCCPLSHRHSSA